MAYENILVERDPAISTITVNRPKALNALNSHTLRELTLAVRECADSRVIILTGAGDRASRRDRKSTRLNSSHVAISYAVFCLKKKNQATVASRTGCATLTRRTD